MEKQIRLLCDIAEITMGNKASNKEKFQGGGYVVFDHNLVVTGFANGGSERYPSGVLNPTVVVPQTNDLIFYIEEGNYQVYKVKESDPPLVITAPCILVQSPHNFLFESFFQ